MAQMNLPASSGLRRSAQAQFVSRLARLPWWLLLIVLAGIFLFYKITTDELYSTILGKLQQGIGLTIFVTLVAYISANLIGLIVGLGRVSKNPIIYNLSTLYVQIIRGVPILVQIFYVAFVITPAFFELVSGIGQGLVNAFGLQPLLAVARETDPKEVGAFIAQQDFIAQIVLPLALATTQSVGLLARAVVALTIAYGGYEAETYRAGIESIGKGQMEAARSLGMSYFQAMRYIILPQAIRRVLPPLGNDFISMLKDSSLVSVLGVRDVTQTARLYVSASFRYPETYNTLAFTYLSMTILLSLGVKWLENRMGKGGRGS